MGASVRAGAEYRFVARCEASGGRLGLVEGRMEARVIHKRKLPGQKMLDDLLATTTKYGRK